jgi:hypothetical protein
MLFNRIKEIESDAHIAAVHAQSTGWAEYKDTNYTDGSPLQLAALTDTLVVNNGLSNIRAYEPAGTRLFQNGKITGRAGEAIIITIEFTAKPTNANTTYIDSWLDIGGSIPPLYKRTYSFPKGNGVARILTSTVLGYTLDTWEANGASLYMNAVNTCDIYGLRYIIARVPPVPALIL